ncbi:hypothetical protein PDESU_03488 [Pontiella desulfatans]|uniref:Uncharacterized protein n=1 Tax=Pontiella desulfatans TaxID=2750659 RepID=A0A6C2U4C5_PONDE|nr:PaaX family transcriptional regulator C-terminal domain-containing protein [Pontiella desulfatans]VGO14918.1 hypothetical protein PDESU_03488 [Pontiella desulfatans]
MKWEPFHHPDLSLPVVRRKVGQELATLLKDTGAMILSKGASDFYGHCYPNQEAFRKSIARLRKQGLVVTPHTDGTMPGLELTPEGEARLPAYYKPDKLWSKPWNHWWYVLVFDIPEKDRDYRNKLRAFLKTLRMGCLQQSVWITPRDIRPEYDDLDHAAAVDSIAHLFESKTVLGHGNQSVVLEAWDFDALQEIQNHYLAYAEKNLSLLEGNRFSPAELMQLLRMDNLAYSQAMTNDPLLPNELLPESYTGKQVFARHQALGKRIAEQIEPH